MNEVLPCCYTKKSVVLLFAEALLIACLSLAVGCANDPAPSSSDTNPMESSITVQESSDDVSSAAPPDDSTSTGSAEQEPKPTVTDESFLWLNRKCPGFVISTRTIPKSQQNRIPDNIPDLFTESDLLEAYANYQALAASGELDREPEYIQYYDPNWDGTEITDSMDLYFQEMEAYWNRLYASIHEAFQTVLFDRRIVYVRACVSLPDNCALVEFEYWGEEAHELYELPTACFLIQNGSLYSLQQARAKQLIDWDALCQIVADSNCDQKEYLLSVLKSM